MPGTKSTAIVAIQCSLIEFLESTLQGKSYVHARVTNPQHEYSKSGAIFEAFFANRPPFSREFNPALAHDVYKGVRCGVLQEARTKNGWTISAKSKNGNIVEPNLKIVYRDNFQSALLDFVEWYKRELGDPTVQISTQRVPQVPLPAQFQERVIQGSNKGW